jgi:predicted AlkP superfamily pyrophosphatase or phosphodiesterase
MRSRPRLRVAALSLLVLGAWPTLCPASPHVVIVGIDGLRPDVALRADMPALRSLMVRGSFTMFAATTDVAVTLPSHMSMLTGVPPNKHGILYNGDPGPSDRIEPLWPTLFTLAHRAGFSTALAAGKSKFSVFTRTGAIDESFIPPAGGEAATDSAVADAAIDWIQRTRPSVLFAHFAWVDLTGHDKGWGTPEQIAAAASADRSLGRILAAIDANGLRDSTLILVSADHGGAVKTHGGLDARSHFIPWIAAGPGVRANYDLTQVPGLNVRTEDTFATACAWLRLVPPKPIDGRPVTEIFENAPTVLR